LTILELLAVVVWWICVLLLFQTYAGIYLSLMIFRPRFRQESGEPDSGTRLPSMTVLIPAYNEEAVIEARILNLLKQDYPNDLLEIVVVSDMSTDNTVAIADRFSDQNVRTIEMSRRQGKLGIIDTVTSTLKSDIITITDANVICDKHALKNLGIQFHNPEVGAVGGNLKLKPPKSAKNVDLEASYRRYEIGLKKLMGRFGKVVGIYGGLYSFRRELFEPIQVTGHPCHDDVIMPLEILQKGYRVNFAENAIAEEETTSTIVEEFRRRARMTAYNLNSLSRTISLSLKAGVVAFLVALSYKVIRWLSPFLFTLFFLSSIFLSSIHPIFETTAIIFIAGILLSLIGGILDRFGVKIWLATAVYHFMMMNLACYLGLISWVRGAKGHWTPRGM